MGSALFFHELIFEKVLDNQRTTSMHHKNMKSYKNLIGATTEDI
jgi:hypothetical protein